MILAISSCSEPESDPTTGAGRSATSAGQNGSGSTTDTVVSAANTSVPGDGSVVSLYAGQQWFLGEVPRTASAVDDSKAPIKVGFINIDSGPIAASPELHQATDAAVAFINAELGGVDGHRIELIACESDLGVDKAQACARKMVQENVVAVLNGLNLSAGAATKILEENEIPWVGGIPLDEAEMRSPIAFHFSGGSPGAFVAFADHAAHQLKAERVAVIYTNVPQVATPIKDYGISLLESFGVEVTELPFDLLGDPTTAVNKAAASDPDALIVGAADTGCPKIMQAIADLEMKAAVYMVGSCADRKWVDQVGADKVIGTMFNVENRIDQSASKSADTEIYNEAITKYGKGVNALGAATVSFKSAMNLYSVMLDQTGLPTAAGIITTFRAARDRPSFDGHPYTCDGKQVPGLPSLCAAHAVLIRMDGAGLTDYSEVSDGWIDVPKILSRRR